MFPNPLEEDLSLGSPHSSAANCLLLKAKDVTADSTYGRNNIGHNANIPRNDYGITPGQIDVKGRKCLPMALHERLHDHDAC